MKFTIKDKRFIQKSDEVIDFIAHYNDDTKLCKELLKGLTNISKIEENKTEFDYVDYKYDDSLLIRNNLGAFIVRENNVNTIEESQDVLDYWLIKRIIKSGDKTILITENNAKYITTKSKEDDYDIEKAVMILLLKRAGYTVKDIYTIINSVK